MNIFDTENHHVKEMIILAYEQYVRLHIHKHTQVLKTEIFTFNTTQFT